MIGVAAAARMGAESCKLCVNGRGIDMLGFVFLVTTTQLSLGSRQRARDNLNE